MPKLLGFVDFIEVLTIVENGSVERKHNTNTSDGKQSIKITHCGTTDVPGKIC